MDMQADPAIDVEYFPPSRPWEERDGEVRLAGSRCPACKAVFFPEKSVCHVCANEKGFERIPLSPYGKLYSYSEVHAAPKGFTVPYVIGYVDLEDGVRLFGQVDHEVSELAVDQPVRVVLGKVRVNPNGVSVISYKFRKK